LERFASDFRSYGVSCVVVDVGHDHVGAVLREQASGCRAET
jgi:hypothetical protein